MKKKSNKLNYFNDFDFRKLRLQKKNFDGFFSFSLSFLK